MKNKELYEVYWYEGVPLFYSWEAEDVPELCEDCIIKITNVWTEFSPKCCEKCKIIDEITNRNNISHNSSMYKAIDIANKFPHLLKPGTDFMFQSSKNSLTPIRPAIFRKRD